MSLTAAHGVEPSNFSISLKERLDHPGWTSPGAPASALSASYAGAALSRLHGYLDYCRAHRP